MNVRGITDAFPGPGIAAIGALDSDPPVEDQPEVERPVREAVMNIDRLIPGPRTNAVNSPPTPPAPAAVPPVRPVKQDHLDLSDAARARHRADQAVRAAPEVRAEKVAELQRQIESGTYPVEPRRIAQKLLEHLAGQS